MKFALVNGERLEAQSGLKGNCPNCERPTIAKCGEKKIHHWAHKGKLVCDPWWENETEWHRNWKNHFPIEWQEVVHTAIDGEKHIADVKTPQDMVIEFQHSFLNPEERRSRNSFYKNIIWIVDGTRRKRDRKQFFNTINELGTALPNPAVKSAFILFSSLIEEWCGTRAPVFFDFGENEKLDESLIWCLLPNQSVSEINAKLVGIPRKEFVDLITGVYLEKGIDIQKYLENATRGIKLEDQLKPTPAPAPVQPVMQRQAISPPPFRPLGRRHFRF